LWEEKLGKKTKGVVEEKMRRLTWDKKLGHEKSKRKKRT